MSPDVAPTSQPIPALPLTSAALKHGWRLNGQGGALPASLADWLARGSGQSQPWWFHFDAAHPDTAVLLEKVFGLDWIVNEALLAEETRPRVSEHLEGLLVILRGVNLNQGAAPEDMVSIRLWITPTLIVSAGVRDLRANATLQERLQRQTGPKSSGDWLTSLCIELYDNVQSVLSDLHATMDALEDDVHAGNSELEDRRIIGYRRRIILLRRYLAPQQDVLYHIRDTDNTMLTPTDRRRLSEAHDWLTRYVEDLDTLRERAQIVRDELDALRNRRLSRNLYVMSLVAALFIPPTLITGLFGVNVGGLPGVDSPWAFSLLCITLALVGVLQVLLLRRKGWF